jgi:uncharacterized protein involved in exopolysaccharide biosynthesis
MNPASTQQSPELQQSYNSPAPGASPTKDRNLDIGRSLRMHRTLAIVVAVAVFVGVFSFGLSRHPYYETSALIYVQPMKTKVITDNSEGIYDPGRYETFVQQQLQTIPRADIVEEALSKPATRAWRFRSEPQQAAVARLQHTLKVERVEQSYELSISLSGSDPVAIADVVNAVSNAYIRGERADEMSQSDQQLQILQDEQQRVSTELTNDRKEQAELSVSLGVADTSGDTGNPYDVQLVELRSELAKATADHDVAAAQYASVAGSASGAESLRSAADDLAATDPAIGTLKQAIGQRRSLLTSQMAGLTPKNPLYVQDQQELDRLDTTLSELEGQVRVKAGHQLQQKLQLEERRTADVVARLSQQLAEKTSIATGATPELQHAADLAADITRLQGRYNAVDNAINTIELDKDTSGLVHILVPATPPLAPKTSMKRLILAAALPLALILGIAAAVIMSKIDPKIYIGKDLVNLLGFYPMATLPNNSEVDRAVKDEFILRLLAGIDQIHRVDQAKTFVFTGASTNVSVTDLVGSLARKMQRLGYRVASIPASELIENHELSSGFFSTARDAEAPPAPMVTHENFVVQKIETMKRETDFLFIDAFPLLSSSETEFAARLSDVVILVAESAETTRGELKSSFALVTRLQVPGAAAVVSQVKIHDADDEFISSVRHVEARRRPVSDQGKSD